MRLELALRRFPMGPGLSEQRPSVGGDPNVACAMVRLWAEDNKAAPLQRIQVAAQTGPIQRKTVGQLGDSERAVRHAGCNQHRELRDLQVDGPKGFIVDAAEPARGDS
jgi:hypothetical protein